jgi:hypothetical protein
MASLRTQVIEQVAILMTGAFGFIAALAWNGAITTLVNEYLDKGNATLPLFVYAIIVTILAVVMTLIIARAAAKAKALDEKVLAKKEK